MLILEVRGIGFLGATVTSACFTLVLYLNLCVLDSSTHFWHTERVTQQGEMNPVLAAWLRLLLTA